MEPKWMGGHWSSTKRSLWFAVITVATVEGATTEPADVIAGSFFHSRVSKGGNRSGCLPFFCPCSRGRNEHGLNEEAITSSSCMSDAGLSGANPFARGLFKPPAGFCKAALGVPELSQCYRLNLADSFSGDAEYLSGFF